MVELEAPAVAEGSKEVLVGVEAEERVVIVSRRRWSVAEGSVCAVGTEGTASSGDMYVLEVEISWCPSTFQRP